MSNIYEELLENLLKNNKVALVTKFSDGIVEKSIFTGNDFFHDTLPEIEQAFAMGKPVCIENDKTIIVEPFSKNERMIIFGGGHISLCLAEFASKVGFSVVVVDDRAEFANRDRFPMAKQVICAPFQDAIKEIGLSESDYIVMVTRGHEQESEILKALFQEEKCKYYGMIGSKARVRGLKQVLANQGIEEKWLEEVRNPIGLDIGAQTPEEIAVAILAEVIMVKRTAKEGHVSVQTDVQMNVIEELAAGSLKPELKRAVVTLIETKGSTPRKAGAKMIVLEDGSIYGTVGGGEEEATMICQALETITTGVARITTLDISEKSGVQQGVLCGGTMKLLVELIHR